MNWSIVMFDSAAEMFSNIDIICSKLSFERITIDVGY